MITIPFLSPTLLALAILVVHGWADFVIQSDGQAAGKPRCWRAMAGHLAGYHAVMAPVALAGWGFSWRAAAFLIISATTHAWLDRRWPVTGLMRLTGSPEFAQSPLGVMVVDQLCHVTVLLGAYAALTPAVW